MQQAHFKSGFVTLIGRPNAGKSSLINRIIGNKIAITSDTAQTTRHRFRAIKTTDDFQLIMVDTPGLHKPHDALGEELNASAFKALEEVDALAFLIDCSQPVGRGDAWVASHLASLDIPKVLVLSKSDLATDAQIDSQARAASELMTWDECVVCSSRTGQGIDEFQEKTVALLPEGPQWFPADMQVDQPLEVIVAEFIREKILVLFSDEIPHAIGVQTEELTYRKKTDLYYVRSIIYVERESQKGMIIGKNGVSLKRIGTRARADLERILGARVYLDLSVKLKKNWRRDATQIKRFGYSE